MRLSNHRRLLEKYNVEAGAARPAAANTRQDGFGWTNGVLLALGSLYPDLKAAAEAATPDPQMATAGNITAR